MNKRCSKCNEHKSLDNFYKKRQSKDGYDFWCKSCWRVQRPTTIATTEPRLRSRSQKSTHFTCENIHTLMGNARKRSNIKDLEFTISTELISKLVHDFCETHKYSWLPYHPFKPSLDRVDSSKGYTPDNIQITWSIENHCKNIYTNDQVIEFCKEKLKDLPCEGL